MSHLRMSVEAVASRSTGKSRDRYTGLGYLFTQSENAAKRYLGSVNLDECGFVEPATVFPARVMRSVDYGIRNAGLDAFVTEYELNGTKVGAILAVISGQNCLGYFSVNYALKQAMEAALDEEARQS